MTIHHETIHGHQFTFTITDKQLEAIEKYGDMDDLQFRVSDGSVRIIDFLDGECETLTFYTDGRVLFEKRDFAYDGWESTELND